jgi:hypothetical protein
MTKDRSARQAGDDIVWDARLPILTDGFLWWDMAKVFLAVYLIVVALMGAVFLAAGEPDSIIRVARVFAVVCSGLLIFSMSVAALWYRNRARVRYALSAEGAKVETLERKDVALNRLAILIALILGKPSAAGAALLAAARESEFTPWKKVTRVRRHDALRVVALLNGRRIVQRLYCPADIHQRIVNEV